MYNVQTTCNTCFYAHTVGGMTFTAGMHWTAFQLWGRRNGKMERTYPGVSPALFIIGNN